MGEQEQQPNREAETIDAAGDARPPSPTDREAATIDSSHQRPPTHDPTSMASVPIGAAETVAGPAIPAAMPTRIAGYRLIRPIASGGMGTVFVAEQDHPQRLVALKVMKQGLASTSALRRFEYESEILGRLRHPGIAQVYDAGMHDDGSGGVPYFAMEYVADARILTDYVRTHRLTESECLELFIDVCEAVHHGHQKGIVHRDLKPANILVDSTGQVKVIDFGVARVTGADRTDTMQTQVGQLVGTVQYMSPEQIEADPNDIDTRSDVYALGLCLYEMLTGRLPYDLEALPLHEATRVIQHVEPRKLRTVTPDVHGDVETIVLHALEKERDRRYQSAHDMAQDIERYLKFEPIVARPPSTWYITNRFIRRNRVVVGFMTALFTALVGGIVGISYSLFMVETERKTAVTNWTRAEAAQGVWDRAMELVTAREGGANDARIVDLLDVIDSEIDLLLKDQPTVESKIRESVGRAYKSIGEYVKSERQLREALRIRRELTPEPTPELAELIRELGSALWFNGDFQAAEPLFREALAMYRSLFPEAHEDTANALNYLAACMNSQRRYEDAEALFREALDMRMEVLLGLSDPELRKQARERVARSKNNLAMSLMAQSRYDLAKAYFADAIDIVAELKGRDHIDVARGLSNLGRCMVELGEFHEAEKAFSESLETKRVRLQPDHSSIAATIHSLADLRYQQGDYAEAEQYARDALRIRQRAFSAGHPRTCESAELLATSIEAQSRFEDASNAWAEAIECLRAQYPAGAAYIQIARQRAAMVLVRTSNFDAAERELLETHASLQAILPEDAPELAESFQRLVMLYEQWGKPEQAAQYRKVDQTTSSDT